MPTALESKAAAEAVAEEAVGVVRDLASSLDGGTEAVRAALLDATPEVVAYYGLASAAVAADFYEQQRAAVIAESFTAQTVVADRTVRVRRGVAWALDTDDWDTALARLTEVVQPETFRPYRDTILTNRRADRKCVGWTRITTGGCGFCRLLAANGSVYREETVRFAAHSNCKCTAAPVFVGGEVGPEASALQYRASSRSRTEAQKAELRRWVAFYEGRDIS